MDEKFLNKAGSLIISLLTSGYLPADRVIVSTGSDRICYTYTNGGTRMRIVRDRGCYQVEALPAALARDEWISLARVTRFLRSRRPEQFVSCPDASNSWIALVAEIGSNIRLINSFFKTKIFPNNCEVLELFEEKNGRAEPSFPETV
jgi:hypothetical protein